MIRRNTALQIVVGLLLALRLYYDVTADLFGDEAYYYLWGQHLAWSYFDHPPLDAWLIRAITTVLPGVIGLRALLWLTLAGVLAIFWDAGKRFAPADPRGFFWTAAAIYLASPLFFGFTLIVYHEHLLILCSLAAVYAFAIFAERAETGARHAIRWLFLAAVALGLAALSKYTGAFVGIGFALTFLLRPKLRPLLLTPYPWLAALVAIAMQTPVIYWNLTEGMASAQFHLIGRWGGKAGLVNWWHPVRFLLMSFAVWSPFLLWPLVKVIRDRPASIAESAARTVALTTLAASTLVLTIVSIFLDAFFYWNIVAVIGVMPLVALRIGRRFALWLHLLFGLLCAGAMVVNFAVLPIAALQGGKDPGSAINYGWAEVAAHMRAADAEAPASFIAGTGYSITAQLSFALGRDVADLSFNPSQFDYWVTPHQFDGQSALVLSGEDDKPEEVSYIRAHFKSFTEVESFPIVRFGRTIYTWHIYRGEDWQR